MNRSTKAVLILLLIAGPSPLFFTRLLRPKAETEGTLGMPHPDLLLAADRPEATFRWDSLDGTGRVTGGTALGATAHPHGKSVCSSSCTLSQHPTEELAVERFEQLVLGYSSHDASLARASLDELIYFGRQSLTFLLQNSAKRPGEDASGDRALTVTDSVGAGRIPLSESLRVQLLQELSRSHVTVRMRLVDHTEAVRAWVQGARVPLNVRHHYDVKVYGISPLTMSGTIKRVGRNDLWARL